MIRRAILPVFVALLMATPLLAQDQPSDSGKAAPSDSGSSGRGDRGNRGGGGGGNFDPAAMRERMASFMKDRMGANDDEWKVIEPKLTKVMDARRDAQGGGGFGMFRGNRGSEDTSNQTPAQSASKALRDTLDNKDASADDIAAKLKAFRDARDKAKTDLAAAQKDLKEVLTQRQEAVLVMFGMLD